MVVDATDNVGTRYLINDACILARKPLVSGAAVATDGQLSVFGFHGGPCYRCLYPTPPPAETVSSCADNGVLGPVPGVIGCLQAIEAVKIITGIGDILQQKLLVYDALSCRFRTVKIRPRSSTCAVCGDVPSITSLDDTEAFCACNNVPSEEGAPTAPKSPSVPSVDCAAYATARSALAK